MGTECCSDLKEYMKKYTIDFQLASLQMHRWNVAERAIRTCNIHFISGFSTTDQDSPIRKRHQLISKRLTALNLLRNSRDNLALSAYAYLFGPYDFNKYPITPPGTRMIVHDKPENQTSWRHHGTQGWYIGQTLDNYRCMQCYMPTTGILRITDTLKYIPKAFDLPKTTIEDYLQQAIGDIIEIMKDPPKTITIFFNSRVPTTVRHRYSLHRICLKLLTRVPDFCPSTDAETID